MNIEFIYRNDDGITGLHTITVDNVDYIPHVGESIRHNYPDNMRYLVGTVDKIEFDYSKNTAYIKLDPGKIKDFRNA